MVVIPLQKICTIVDNKYKAIIIAAKEARRLNKLSKDKPDILSNKPTIIAIKKLLKGEIQYKEEV